jgi:Fe-S-cluster containining protein
MKAPRLPARDKQLVQIVDAALAEVSARAGKWLACRPGCTQCCVGVCAISDLDALRLRAGLDELQRMDSQRAQRLLDRAAASRKRLESMFPGNVATGELRTSAEDETAWEEFGNDEVCPALDPNTGLCDLYAARPMTCRVFGPPVQTGEGLGTCELCFQGATDEQIAACEMVPDPDDLESELDKEIGHRAKTLVAWALNI